MPKLSQDYNLAVLHPDVAKEWHPTKNGDLTAKGVTPGSNKNIWWMCGKGHEWETTANGRTGSKNRKGRGCPFCAGKKVGKDNNLLVKFPEVTKEWHPTKNGDLTPRDVMPGTDRKVWWLCGKGHDWEASVDKRTGGRGCPYCSGRRVSKENNLLVKNPKIAKEWHPTKNEDLTPQDVTSRTGRKVWWLCGKGHEWEAVVAARTGSQNQKEQGCPFCAGRRVSKEHNLLVKYPKIAKEWHPTKNGHVKPQDVMPGTHRKVWWLCGKGHNWEASVNKRTGGRGCPHCYKENRNSVKKKKKRLKI